MLTMHLDPSKNSEKNRQSHILYGHIKIDYLDWCTNCRLLHKVQTHISTYFWFVDIEYVTFGGNLRFGKKR